MSHVTPEMENMDDDQVIAHLETCSRCRSQVATDTDVDMVLVRILDSVDQQFEPVKVKAVRWWAKPWIVVPGAAALVAALFIPLAWLGDGIDSSLGGTGTTLPPAPEPPVGTEAQSVELMFEADKGIYGRLIWSDPTFFEGVRITRSADGPIYDYGFYRADTEVGRDADGFDPFEPFDPKEGWADHLPKDPLVPWDLLIERPTIEEMWTRLGGDLPIPQSTESTHPEAQSAFVASGLRLEVADDGLPVLVESDDIGRFSVTAIDRRPVRAGEVGNNIDLPFMYALYLAADTTAEQESALMDGIVTFSEYESAVAAAAQCAGVDAHLLQSGMFTFQASDSLEECVDRHVSDVEEVWRVSSQLHIPDFEIIWATVEGRPDQVELYSATEGPRFSLGVYSMFISRRGPGYCLRYAIAQFASAGCSFEKDMDVPYVLTADIILTYDDDRIILSGAIAGIVTEEADRLVITFESGDSVEVDPGQIAAFGYSGYGYEFESSWGEPTTVEAFSGNKSLGVYSHLVGEHRP